MAKIIFFLLASLWAQGDQKEIYPVIFGGVPIPVEAAPYIAVYLTESLQGSSRCGASIITKNHLVSAAHCYKGGYARNYVIVGTENRHHNGDRYDVHRVIVHPTYNAKSNDNDILVLKLAQSLVFSSRVKPIALAERNLVIPQGAMLNAMGYGQTLENADNDDLYKISIPYVDTITCESVVSMKITTSMLCAGRRPYENVYKGDSGGPLVYGQTLVGVTSFVFSLEHNGVAYMLKPVTVFARVSTLRDFIDGAIRI